MHIRSSQWLGWLVKLGAIAGMTSVILMSLLGQPRIFLAMADDGLLPPIDAQGTSDNTARRTSRRRGRLCSQRLIAGLFPLNVLGELISIGILLAFTVVCIGVLVLRYTQPEPAPAVPRAVGAGHLRARRLDLRWNRRFPATRTLVATVGIWSLIGFSIYAFYGYRHSRLRADGK